MLWTCDADGFATFHNRRWLAFTGRSRKDELGWGWLEGMHNEDRAECSERFNDARRTRAPFTLAYRLRRADGQFRWILGHGSPWLDSGGGLLGYVGSAADISDRQEHLVALAESERNFRRLIENADDFVYRSRVVPTPAIEYIGGSVEAITGLTADEFYANPDAARQAIHPDDHHYFARTAEAVASMARVFTIRWIHRDGKVVWAEHRRTPVFDADGQIVGIEGIARDVTDHVETLQQLRHSREQLRRLAARVEAAREDERTALARELHDELGQSLTAIKLELVRADGVFRKEGVNLRSIDRLQSLVGLVEIALATVKRISTDLRPPALDHLGLADAVRWEAVTFRARTGLRCRVHARGDDTRLSAQQQTVVFRIFQEALTNVVRHARAGAVQVGLAERGGVFELRVRDNGRGVTPSQAADPKAIGLLGMRERATLIGGTFEITGRRGKGTVVSVRVPLSSVASPSSNGGQGLSPQASS